MRRYADIRSFVNNSEFTVWSESGPAVEHFAVLIAPGMRPPVAWLPAAARAH